MWRIYILNYNVYNGCWNNDRKVNFLFLSKFKGHNSIKNRRNWTRFVHNLCIHKWICATVFEIVIGKWMMTKWEKDGGTEWLNGANTICPSHFMAGHTNQVVQSRKTAASQKCPFWMHNCWRPVVGSKYFWRIPQFKHCTDTLAWQMIIYRKKSP